MRYSFLLNGIPAAPTQYIFDRTTDGADVAPSDDSTTGIDCANEDWLYFHFCNVKNFTSYRLWIYGMAGYDETHLYFAPIATALYNTTSKNEGLSDIIRVTNYERFYIRVFDGTGVNLAGDILYALSRESYPRQVL